jgi:prolyl-tRNA synthetase
MLSTQTYTPTLRAIPAEAVISSHALMLRAAIMRKLSNGLFAYLPLGLRVFRKIEAIIRAEIDATGALEIRPPVVVPADLWRESGRYDTMGDAMLKATNRVDQELVISPTAEEAVTAIVRADLASYKQLPLNFYQINTKYRDEIRPRYGVMRGREFTMFDGYSYHTDDESLDATYQKYAAAYRRIFARVGLSIIPVKADSGAMGGSGSEEFMVESPIGDDDLILCPNCNSAANVETATCADDVTYGHSMLGPDADDAATAVRALHATPRPIANTATPPMEKIDTPAVKTIDDLCTFLKRDPTAFIKTLVYRTSAVDKKFVVACIRGDLDVNETKLANAVGAAEVALADDADVTRITGAPVGFAGPIGLTGVTLVLDPTVTQMHDAVTGALEKDKHFIHVEPGRDFAIATDADTAVPTSTPAGVRANNYSPLRTTLRTTQPTITSDIRTVKSGDTCPVCGAPLYAKKGNELGHIFKLGRKYTDALNVTYLDAAGKSAVPTMGCYGIGVDRTLASVIEAHHDDRGIAWPATVAPYHVAIVPIKYAAAMKTAADALYAALTAAGIESYLDDRDERPGVKFADADLLGFPIRVVVGDKNLPNVEVKARTAETPTLVDINSAAETIAQMVTDAITALNGGT